MRIAIGSTREPKVEAVEEAWQVFAAKILEDPDEEVTFLSYDVSNGIPSMPLSVCDLMHGALGRVDNLTLQLKREKAEADFYIGLESGFSVVNSQGPRRQVFLQSWAYVSDGHRGFFGHGGGVSVPPVIADPVIDRGIELGIAIDRLSDRRDVRSKQGTWGILTRDILTRRHSFVIALIAAFAPFYNSEAYGS
ncbi:inosine/xanthosine triphosphatase [Acidobacteria bacterium AH-259-A15]|nr:inosine/xanthosine triphosphatase [Acidobacteria bacterium AH-259-A15]